MARLLIHEQAKQCRSTYDWNIPALPSGNSYDGPNANQTNLCLCSSVVYTAVSACGSCQGEAWITWPVWKLECDPTIITVANYKFDIPPGTAIPRWMYQDPTQQSGVSFNNTLAYSVASQGLPDVTSSSNSAVTSGNTSAPTAASSSGGGNSANIGAIVGGVIGGIGVLTAMAIIGWWFIRRRHSTRSSQAPSKQYIAKWSKEVPAGQAPSRGGGTSYGSDSIMGDSSKEREMMTSPASTLPTTYLYGTDGHLPYAKSKPRNRSFETTQPQQPVAYYPASPPSSYPAKRARDQGHKKDHSGSSSFSRKLMGIPSTADNITPFYLPPVETTVTSDPELSTSPSRSDGRESISYSVEQPSSRSRSTRPSRKRKAPVLAEPLPSKIEYFQSRPPPLANNSATNVTNAASTIPYGRTSTEGNRSRSSFTGSRAGFYNPDDPSTYPTATDTYGRAPSSRRTSADQLPGPAPISPPIWPDAASEKAALANRDYTPQTMPTPGHSGYAYSTGHQSRTMPTPPIPQMSPYGNRSVDSPSQSPPPSQPLMGASLGLANSVHTIQGFDDPELEQEQPLRAAPSGPVPQHQRQESSETESAGAGNGFFSSFGRRVRPGGRSNESNNSQAPPAASRQFSIHIRNSQVGPDEFNPYRTS
ncbi:hypothetical protein FRC04_005881 [Tulasnella sp. 424]|nr:hypothetical protein FRC04_005881 [Tulasnella sp. 424]